MENLKENQINKQESSPSSYKPKIESTPVQFYKSLPEEEPYVVKRTEGDTRAVATPDGVSDPHEAFNYILQSIYDLKSQVIELRLW